MVTKADWRAVRKAYGGSEADRERARAEPAQMGRLVDALMRLRTPDEAGADIFPGRRHPLPFSNLYWMTFMMQPGVSGAGGRERVRGQGMGSEWGLGQEPSNLG